jgi:hypothetical protein
MDLESTQNALLKLKLIIGYPDGHGPRHVLGRDYSQGGVSAISGPHRQGRRLGSWPGASLCSYLLGACELWNITKSRRQTLIVVVTNSPLTTHHQESGTSRGLQYSLQATIGSVVVF